MAQNVNVKMLKDLASNTSMFDNIDEAFNVADNQDNASAADLNAAGLTIKATADDLSAQAKMLLSLAKERALSLNLTFDEKNAQFSSADHDEILMTDANTGKQYWVRLNPKFDNLNVDRLNRMMRRIIFTALNAAKINGSLSPDKASIIDALGGFSSIRFEHDKKKMFYAYEQDKTGSNGICPKIIIDSINNDTSVGLSLFGMESNITDENIRDFDGIVQLTLDLSYIN